MSKNGTCHDYITMGRSCVKKITNKLCGKNGLVDSISYCGWWLMQVAAELYLVAEQ